MVKFICTRQDWVAERLGVQALTFSGYPCPTTDKLVDQDNLTPEAENLSQNAVSGLFLLNKTLFFIQQLTRDMASHQDSQSVLVFTGRCHIFTDIWRLNVFQIFYIASLTLYAGRISAKAEVSSGFQWPQSEPCLDLLQ